MKDNNLDVNYSIKLKDKLWPSTSPLVMGILNITPDSFYSGSRNMLENDILNKIERWMKEGLDILDLGAISTRPNADLQDESTELARLIPIVKSVHKTYPELPISIDTFRSKVAKAALDCGADLINDVYANRYDGQMFKTISEYQVPYILMHSRGDASNMTTQTNYGDLMGEIIQSLSADLAILNQLGVKDVIIDPGFGFAKDLHQNYALLKNLNQLGVFGRPILAGLSRKSMIYKLLGKEPKDVLTATSTLNMVALMNGASILRVHDIKEAKETIALYKALQQ